MSQDLAGFPSLEAPPVVSWELSLGPLSGLTLPLQGTCWLGLVRRLFCWPACSHFKMYFLPFFACLHLKNNCQHLKMEHSDLLKNVFLKRSKTSTGSTRQFLWGHGCGRSTCSGHFRFARPPNSPSGPLVHSPCPARVLPPLLEPVRLGLCALRIGPAVRSRPALLTLSLQPGQ